MTHSRHRKPLLSLAGSEFSPRERLRVGVLGPRGTTSIVFGLIAFTRLPERGAADTILIIMVTCVLGSVLLHGAEPAHGPAVTTVRHTSGHADRADDLTARGPAGHRGDRHPGRRGPTPPRSGGDMTGDRLLKVLRELRATYAAETDAWQLSGSTWQASVLVNPGHWLGLEFKAHDPVTGRRATYDIDTDLYDISQEQQREFAEEIERDIIEFLENLRRGAVLRGNDGKKFVLVFPLDGAYVRVVQGRFLTKASTHVDPATAQTGDGDYVPLD
jgi:hypothetical protein